MVISSTSLVSILPVLLAIIVVDPRSVITTSSGLRVVIISLIISLLTMRVGKVIHILVKGFKVIVTKERRKMKERSHKVLHGFIEILEFNSVDHLLMCKWIIFEERTIKVKESSREGIILIHWIHWYSLLIFICIVSIVHFFCAN